MRVWAVVVVLVLSLLPTMEAVEAAVHFAEYGDLAHDQHDRGGDDLGASEHGCSGTFHLCGCHTANLIPAIHSAVVRSAAPHVGDCCFDLSSWIGLGATAPPIRPPIA